MAAILLLLLLLQPNAITCSCAAFCWTSASTSCFEQLPQL
jgi:hypothetical protein